MITIQKFCCCLRLEMGGLVIGGLTFIVNALVFLYIVYNFIIKVPWSCSWDGNETENDTDDVDYNYTTSATSYENYQVEVCKTTRRVWIGMSVTTMFFFIGMAYISFIFIQGTKARNHKRVMPMLILLGVALVFSASGIYLGFINVLGYGFRYLWHVGSLIIATAIVLNVYSFVVVYSLYSLFRREHKTGDNPNSYQVQFAAKV